MAARKPAVSKSSAKVPRVKKGGGEKNSRGRPSVWTPELEARIIQMIEVPCCTYRDAAEANGIGYETLKGHVRKDAEFSFRLQCARARAKVAALGIIAAAMAKHPQACQWWLERVYPDEYGQKMVVAGGGPDDAPIAIAFSQEGQVAARIRSDEELIEAHLEFLARGGARESRQRKNDRCT